MVPLRKGGSKLRPTAFNLEEKCYNNLMKISLVLHNIRSTYNVGAILRTAEGLGIDEVVLSGYTPRYDDVKLLPHLRTKLNHQIAKSALGAETMVTQVAVDDLETWLDERRRSGWIIVGLENNLGIDELSKKQILGKQQLADQPVVLILGEEVAGIPAEIRRLCDCFLEIPMLGRKESFNVSVATAMALWELKRLVL